MGHIIAPRSNNNQASAAGRKSKVKRLLFGDFQGQKSQSFYFGIWKFLKSSAYLCLAVIALVVVFMQIADFIALRIHVRTFLITESLDVGAGLLKLLLVIEHICKPAPTWFLLSTQHSALSTQHFLHCAITDENMAI